MSSLLDYDKLNNIRDLGGERTRDGRVIIPGRLIRSENLLDLPESDINKLEELAETVVDFRSGGEHDSRPDSLIPGVSYHHLPIIDKQAAGITREEEDVDIFSRMLTDPAGAKQYMCGLYKDFVTSDFSVSQYAKFVRLVMEKHEKAVLWHCTAGKDRAGMAAVILEEILGVPREDIIEDYLSSNKYLSGDISMLTGFIKKRAGICDDSADEALKYLFGAERDYIETFYRTVEERYGDFESFIHEGLGISEDEVEKMRDTYLTKTKEN